MKIRNESGRIVIVLARGERVIESIAAVCEQEGITGAVFHAIGAVKNSKIGYYDVGKRAYFFQDLTEDREVASMSGNVALVDGKPFVHCHAVLSAAGESLACVGGHVKECEVAVTLEIVLSDLKQTLKRAMDDSVGLKLLDI